MKLDLIHWKLSLFINIGLYQSMHQVNKDLKLEILMKMSHVYSNKYINDKIKTLKSLRTNFEGSKYN